MRKASISASRLAALPALPPRAAGQPTDDFELQTTEPSDDLQLKCERCRRGFTLDAHTFIGRKETRLLS